MALAERRSPPFNQPEASFEVSMISPKFKSGIVPEGVYLELVEGSVCNSNHSGAWLKRNSVPGVDTKRLVLVNE
jgi:hypothetical protein